MADFQTNSISSNVWAKGSLNIKDWNRRSWKSANWTYFKNYSKFSVAWPWDASSRSTKLSNLFKGHGSLLALLLKENVAIYFKEAVR